MDLLIIILAVLSILFGIGLLFTKGFGNFLAAGTAIFAGIIAYDEMSLWPIGIGFAILWGLRLLGYEGKN